MKLQLNFFLGRIYCANFSYKLLKTHSFNLKFICYLGYDFLSYTAYMDRLKYKINYVRKRKKL